MQLDFGLPNNLFHQHFSSEFVGEEYLLAGEKELIKSYADKRIKDFSTGRFCARQALLPLQHINPEIGIGAKNEPLWPQGIVGSISHSKELVGAVVASSNNLKSIGLDIETIGKVKPSLWERLFLPSEQTFLKNLNAADAAFYSSAFFSMKESFYKLQYPITKTYLDFLDVEIKQVNETFELRMLKSFSNDSLIPAITTFSLVKEGNQVISLCYF